MTSSTERLASIILAGGVILLLGLLLEFVPDPFVLYPLLGAFAGSLAWRAVASVHRAGRKVGSLKKMLVFQQIRDSNDWF